MFASATVGSTATVVRNSVSIISHITFRDCRVHIFADNLSRNSCINPAVSRVWYLLSVLFFTHFSFQRVEKFYL